MDRRSFIKCVAGGLAALAAPTIKALEVIEEPSVTLDGFTFITDPFPMRFIFTPTGFKAIDPFIHDERASKINPAYVNEANKQVDLYVRKGKYLEDAKEEDIRLVMRDYKPDHLVDAILPNS